MERDIEKYFREQVKAAGGMAPKFTSPSNTGWPDRLALFPGGKIAFVELKDATRQDNLSSRQRLIRTTLRDLGFKYYKVWNKEQVKRLIDEICTP